MSGVILEAIIWWRNGEREWIVEWNDQGGGKEREEENIDDCRE